MSFVAVAMLLIVSSAPCTTPFEARYKPEVHDPQVEAEKQKVETRNVSCHSQSSNAEMGIVNIA